MLRHNFVNHSELPNCKVRSLLKIAVLRKSSTVVCLVAILWMSGCASVVIRKVPVGNAAIEGIRFYRPRPYLMVSESTTESKPASGAKVSDSIPALQFTIVWLPDLSQEYAIQGKPGLGSIEYAPTLENGWNLTAMSAKADSKTAELLTAIAGFIPQAKAAASAAGPPAIKPGMYPFVFEEDTKSANFGRLKGVDFDHPIFQAR